MQWQMNNLPCLIKEGGIMTAEERNDELEEKKALNEAKRVADRKRKDMTKKIIMRIAKAAAAALPIILLLIKVFLGILIFLAIFSAITITINDETGDSSNNQIDISEIEGEVLEGNEPEYLEGDLPTYNDVIGELSNRTYSEGYDQRLKKFLKQFSYDLGAKAERDETNRYYKLYLDADPGLPTIGDDDLEWSSHRNKFNGGGNILIIQDGKATYLHVDNVRESVEECISNAIGEDYVPGEAYNKEQFETVGIYIDAAIVDVAGLRTRYAFYNMVDSMGLTELSENQKNALIAIAYSRGNLNIQGRGTFYGIHTQAIEAGYSVNTWQYNRMIWDEWWAYLPCNYPGIVKARDAQFEMFVNNKDNVGPIFGRTEFLYYTQAQWNYQSTICQGNMPQGRLTRIGKPDEVVFRPY